MDAIAARQAARQAHQAMVSAVRDLERAEQNAVLRFAEILHLRYYRHLGFASIVHYATEALGFSRAKTAQFVRLAQDMKRLPALQQAVAKNELEWTKARTIGPVATVDNQHKWISRAKKTSRQQLERDVRRARKRPRQPAAQMDLVPAPPVPAGDPPVRVSFELTPLQLAEYEKLMEKVRGHRSKADVLLAALSALAESQSSQRVTRVTPPVQLVVHRCEKCKRASVPTEGADRTLSSAEATAAACDCVEFRPDAPNRSPIPPKLRKRVLARDGHRCTVCGTTRRLHVHHGHKREDGGPNTLENCTTLCATCHVNRHREEGLLERGIALEREDLPRVT